MGAMGIQSPGLRGFLGQRNLTPAYPAATLSTLPSPVSNRTSRRFHPPAAAMVPANLPKNWRRAGDGSSGSWRAGGTDGGNSSPPGRVFEGDECVGNFASICNENRCKKLVLFSRKAGWRLEQALGVHGGESAPSRKHFAWTFIGESSPSNSPIVSYRPGRV